MNELTTEVRDLRRAVPANGYLGAQPVRFTPGTVLANRYRIVAPLGRGGMGEVYRADDLRIGQQVALKFLPQSVSGDQATLGRLFQEIRIGRHVSHPNVCRMYDVVEWDQTAFIAMEYIDGEDLASLLKRIGRLPHDKAVAIARDIATGLAAAHALGVIHRDLKPANVMIDGRGNGRITDFGLAVIGGNPDPGRAVEGTPAYMAPEQLAGAAVTELTDIYAFGLTVYELLTGKRFFQATSIKALRAEHGARPHSFSGDSAEIEPAMQRLILWCIEEDPAARPRSMKAVLRAMPAADQIQAALDAGETLSPEMLAAAGEHGELEPAIAWPLLLVTLLLLIAAYVSSSRINLTALVKLPEAPEALAFRARDVLASLAPGAVAPHSFHRFGFDTTDFDDRVRAAGSVERAAELRPSLARFYYKQSPTPMVHRGRDMLWDRSDPPLDVPGMAEVALDPDGRLIGTTIVPPRMGNGAADGDYDWTVALEAAGVRRDSLRAVPPAHTPPVASDRRYAWSAAYPGRDLVRIEAATYQGKPVWFEVFPRWREATAPPGVTAGALAKAFATFGIVVFVVAVIASAALASRNVVRKRADTKAATRLGGIVAVLSFIGLLVHIDHLADPEIELELLTAAAGQSLFWGVVTWSFYAAIEPYLRQRWPRSLVGWRRAIDGRFRDPLVGREILIGVATGAAVVALGAVAVMLSGAIGPRATPTASAPSTLEGPLHFFENFTVAVAASIYFVPTCALVLLLTRLLVRRQKSGMFVAAVLLATVLWPVVPAEGGWAPIVARLILAGAAVSLISRRGLLALAFALFTVLLFLWMPLTLDTSSWFFWRPAIAALLLLSLTLWGFVHSLGNRLVLGAAALEG